MGQEPHGGIINVSWGHMGKSFIEEKPFELGLTERMFDGVGTEGKV